MAPERDHDLVRVETDLRVARQRVVRAMSELQREVARAVDWRGWLGRKPGLMMGLAFGAGLLLGGVLSRRDR